MTAIVPLPLAGDVVHALERLKSLHDGDLGVPALRNLLLTGETSGISEEEQSFLGDAARSGRRVFIVVNKADMVSTEERAEALAYLREQLATASGTVSMYSVSARNGLAAKQAHDPRLLQDSGLDAFEEALLRFLIEDKSREFLLSMCERVARLLRVLPPGPEISRLAEQLMAVAQRVDAGRASNASSPAIAVTPDMQTNIGQIRPCEICIDVARQSYDFLRRYQYDIIVSPDRQCELAERSGLCSFHIWAYESLASPVGTCAGFAAVLDRLAERLLSAAAARSSFSTALPLGAVAESSCIVCEARAAAETAAIKAIALQLRQSVDDALCSLSDLCIPHFRLLTAAVDDPDITARLFNREAALLQRVAEDMRRYALKHEGGRRYLASLEETRAGQRALLLIGGHRTLNTPVRGATRPEP